jgi:hypothetical protein
MRTNERLQIQGDRKVTQPILKYLLMVTIQYNSIGLINTQYRCDDTRAHTGHAMLQPVRAGPSVVFKQLKCKDVFFTSATSVHCRTLYDTRSYLTFQNWFRDTFPDSPMPDKSTMCRLVNRFRDTGSVQDRNRLFAGLHQTRGKE